MVVCDYSTFRKDCRFDISLEVEHIHVIEKLSIKASKHNQTVAHQNYTGSSPGFREWVSNLELGPLLAVNIELVQITHVCVVSSSQEQKLVVPDRSAMTPSSRGYVFGLVNFSAQHFRF